VRSFYYIIYRNSVCTSQESHYVSATQPTRSLRTNNHTLPSHLRLWPLSVASYGSQGLRWRYSNPPPHGAERYWASKTQQQQLPTATSTALPFAFQSHNCSGTGQVSVRCESAASRANMHSGKPCAQNKTTKALRTRMFQ
jgi:hypothetical protein